MSAQRLNFFVDSCFSYLGCLAAVITLSGFLTSTITQQAIVYPVLQAERDNGTATVARATSFSLYNGSNLDIGLSQVHHAGYFGYSRIIGAANRHHSSVRNNAGEASSRPRGLRGAYRDRTAGQPGVLDG